MAPPTRYRRRHRLPLIALAVAVSWVVLPQVPAEAHAVLVSSDPAAGANLATVPARVDMVFDEPLVATLSTATVTTPTGRKLGSTVSGKTMTVRLSGNSHGVYRVMWKTVSKIDGHTITGAFQFGVQTVTSAERSTAGPSPADIGLSVLRGIEYTVLLLACGVWLLTVLGRDVPVRPPATRIAAALLAAGVATVLAESAVAGSGLSPGGLAAYLTNGLTGWARLARVALEGALVVLATARGRLSVPLLGAVVAAIAVAGHGADVEPSWRGIAVNAAHLAAAGLWAGGIMALGLVRLRGRWSTEGRRVLPRFSRVAPWAFGASVGLGAIQAAQLLGGPSPVLHTSYGLTLVAKAVAVAAMVPLSLLAWRRTRVHIRAEALLAVVVTACAAALAAFPVIPKEAREAVADQEAALVTHRAALPETGDLTMAGRAGPVMVGLTLHPGVPGTNTVKVYLASPATRHTTARIKVRGHVRRLGSCGTHCRIGRVSLHGRETVRVEVSGEGTATYRLPPLPARDASRIAAAAFRTMDGLYTYRDHEDLSGIRTDYRYVAPHRMFVRTWLGAGPRDTLWLGRALYHRATPDSPWRRQASTSLARVPYYPWYPFRPLVDAHVIGSSHVAGTPVSMVSVFDGAGPDPDALWFTLYVDPTDHRILRSQMWATNHFMNDRYYAVNEPVRLPRP